MAFSDWLNRNFKNNFFQEHYMNLLENCWNDGYKSANEWHDNKKEPIPTENNHDYVVRLYNGNTLVVYWSIHTFKDCATGEHIPLNVIKLWIQLPKDN